jgi:hypothetical protein
VICPRHAAASAPFTSFADVKAAIRRRAGSWKPAFADRPRGRDVFGDGNHLMREQHRAKFFHVRPRFGGEIIRDLAAAYDLQAAAIRHEGHVAAMLTNLGDDLGGSHSMISVSSVVAMEARGGGLSWGSAAGVPVVSRLFDGIADGTPMARFSNPCDIRVSCPQEGEDFSRSAVSLEMALLAHLCSSESSAIGNFQVPLDGKVCV